MVFNLYLSFVYIHFFLISYSTGFIFIYFYLKFVIYLFTIKKKKKTSAYCKPLLKLDKSDKKFQSLKSKLKNYILKSIIYNVNVIINIKNCKFALGYSLNIKTLTNPQSILHIQLCTLTKKR